MHLGDRHRRRGDGQRTRYWLIENLMNPRVRSFREAYYTYHLNGLDVMHSDVESGRIAMLESLQAMEQVNTSYPNSTIIPIFCTSKAQEIVEIFKLGLRREQVKVYQLMGRMDPGNLPKYDQLK